MSIFCFFGLHDWAKVNWLGYRGCLGCGLHEGYFHGIKVSFYKKD